ncbi:hypothetical protein MTP03_07170 [Tsukamurella sp. PLM1]|nr:hypothetical protein MTP03_07170 [Tsukamurella sp. PLM1]
MTDLTIEQAAAAFVTGLTFETISAEALAGTRRLMEDQLALQVGCSSLPWCQAILDLTRASHAPGVSSVTASDDRFSAADAAFVNATFGHSFEYDDAHSASLSHPGSAVVSAAIAIGEETGATIEDVLVGIVAGYEIYTRIGTLAAPMLLQNGFHPHAVLSLRRCGRRREDEGLRRRGHAARTVHRVQPQFGHHRVHELGRLDQADPLRDRHP